MDCPCCSQLTEENLRKAFETRVPLSISRISLDGAWHRAISPGGKEAVRAKFFCDACGHTTTIVIEMTEEKDVADWWKGESQTWPT